jgi:hypothetical protein
MSSSTSNDTIIWFNNPKILLDDYTEIWPFKKTLKKNAQINSIVRLILIIIVLILLLRSNLFIILISIVIITILSIILYNKTSSINGTTKEQFTVDRRSIVNKPYIHEGQYGHHGNHYKGAVHVDKQPTLKAFNQNTYIQNIIDDIENPMSHIMTKRDVNNFENVGLNGTSHLSNMGYDVNNFHNNLNLDYNNLAYQKNIFERRMGDSAGPDIYGKMSKFFNNRTCYCP